MCKMPKHPSDIKPLGICPDGYPRIEQRIVQVGKHRWVCHTTHGIAIVGELPLTARTRNRIERKAERLSRRLRQQDERNRAAEVVVR